MSSGRSSVPPGSTPGSMVGPTLARSGTVVRPKSSMTLGKASSGCPVAGCRGRVADGNGGTGRDGRQNVGGEAVELDRPAADEGAARVQVAVVVESVDAAGAAGRRESRGQDGAGVEPGDGGGVVLLVREELVRVAARLVHLVRLDHDL